MRIGKEESLHESHCGIHTFTGKSEDKGTGRNVLIKREKAKCNNERHSYKGSFITRLMNIFSILNMKNYLEYIFFKIHVDVVYENMGLV